METNLFMNIICSIFTFEETMSITQQNVFILFYRNVQIPLKIKYRCIYYIYTYSFNILSFDILQQNEIQCLLFLESLCPFLSLNRVAKKVLNYALLVFSLLLFKFKITDNFFNEKRAITLFVNTLGMLFINLTAAG